jgi:hypothetical protein
MIVNKMKYFISLLLSIVTIGANAQTDWHLKRDGDGIKVFVANRENSDFKSIKVECVAKATLSQFVGLLLDAGRAHEWVYGTQSSEIIKTIKANDYYFYSRVNVPWPCADRDYIAHIIIAQHLPHMLAIDATSEPGMVPVHKGIVRVTDQRAHWEVFSTGRDSIKIIYIVRFDPAGHIPALLTNLFLTSGPFNTFRELQQRVQLPEYRNAYFDFVKD